MWNIFRIEWEVIVLEDRLILSKDDEDEKLMEKEWRNFKLHFDCYYSFIYIFPTFSMTNFARK